MSRVGVPFITVTEERGLAQVPSPGIDRLALIIGCSSAGTAGYAGFFANSEDAIATLGYGDAVDELTHTIERNQVPCAFYKVPSTNDGSYGDVDDDGVTGPGIIDVDASVKPLGTYEAGIYVDTGFTVGEAGGRIRYTLDGWRTSSGPIAVGTATYYTIPNAGVKFTFSPSGIDLTALNTLINELYTDQNAHVILTSGGVHGAADTADVVSIASASDTATRVARINALRAAYELHRIKTAGGVHGSADNANVIVAPVATDDSSALILALDFKAKYEAHRARTTAATHGLADGTNAVTSPDPDAGVFAAGDVANVRTFGPLWSTDDLSTAETDLKESSAEFSILVVCGPMEASDAAFVSGILDKLESTGRPCVALVEASLQDRESDESEATWRDRLLDDWASFDDDRIHVRAGDCWVIDPVTRRQYLRTHAPPFLARAVAVGRQVWPAGPADQQLEGVSLVDALGNLIGHDDGDGGRSVGLSDSDQGARFGCVYRPTDSQHRLQVYATAPWVMFTPGGRVFMWQERRIVNAIIRTAMAVSFSSLSGTAFYTPASTDPPAPAMLTESARGAIRSSIFTALSLEHKDDILNYSDDDPDNGLVQVDPIVTPSSGIVQVSVVVAPILPAYIGGILIKIVRRI